MSEEYEDFDDDFDDIDEEAGMGFEDADNEDPNKERNAVTETFKGAAPHFMDDFKDTHALKQVGDVADSAFQAIAGKKVSANYNKIKGTLTKEIDKSSREIKAAAKPFVSKLKDSLPEDSAVGNILGKLDNFLGSDRTSGEESEEARASRESNELLISIFGEQSKREVLDQTITSLANKGRDDLLRQITAIGQTTLDFHNSNTIGYYKKSIELKYKHLFETKRMFKLQLKSFETFKRQFETIVKNTGLPEFVKIRGLEAAKANIRERAFGTAYESLTNNNDWVQNARTNITNRFRSTTQGITDGLFAASEGMDMVGELGEQFSDADQRNMLIGSMGAEGSRTITGRILGKVLGKTKRGKKFHEWINKVNGDPGSYFGGLAEKYTGWKSKAAQSVANIVSLDDNYEPYKDLARESLDAATFLDNRTKKSINIIPSILGKIYGSIEGIRTGNDPDGLTYDFTKDVLVKDSLIKGSIIRDFTSKTTKAHTAGIESVAKLLVDAAGLTFTPAELKAFATRLTMFGIKDKNLTIERMEEVGFFKGLDARVEMMYRSIFANAGKDNEGKIDHNVRAVLNKELGAAVNIRSDPSKIIQEAIDNGHTQKLIDLGILKWDPKKTQYVIDLARFDMYTIKGINDNLFKEQEDLTTVDDSRQKKISDFVSKTKTGLTDKVLKGLDKILDPVMQKIADAEETYDDPASKSRLRSIKEVFRTGKEEALKGNDEVKTKKKLKELGKTIISMLKNNAEAAKKSRKSKWQALKDAGSGIFNKFKTSGLKDDVIKDAKDVADRAKRAASGMYDKVDEEFDMNFLEKINNGKIAVLGYFEKMVIKSYLLDPVADKKVIKAMKAIVFDHISTLDKEDIKSLTAKGILDIYQNIIDDIEDAGLHLQGINAKKVKEDLETEYKKAKKKGKEATEGLLEDKETDGATTKYVKERLRKLEEGARSKKKAFDKNKKEKEAKKKEEEKDAPKDKKGKKISWIAALTTNIETLTKNLSMPKFGKGDKDKDGDRDGGYLDRLDFFKRTKGKAKSDKKDKDDEKKGTGIFGMVGKLFGATLFAPIAFIAKSLAGVPKAFGGILDLLGSMKGALGLIGTAISWGFSSVMGIVRLGGFLSKGIGKLDKWLGPKLRKVLNPKKLFSKKGLLLAGAGLLAADNWDYIKDKSGDIASGAKDMWEGVGDDSEPIDMSHPSFAMDNDYKDDSPTENAVKGNMKDIAAVTAASLAAKEAAKNLKKIQDKEKPKTTKLPKGAKFAGKSLGKLMPGTSIPLYGYEAKTRYDEGNYLGAAASALAIPLSFLPFGTVAGLAITMATEEDAPDPTPEEKAIIKNKSRGPLKTNVAGMNKLLLDRIAKGEINTTEAKGYNITLGFGKYVPKGTKPLYTMTIDEVYQLQNIMVSKGARSSAVGRYQFIQDTLKDVVKSAKIDSATTIFSPAVQDLLILHRLNRYRGYSKWRKGTLTDKMFILNLSKEFASIACPIDTSHYDKKKKETRIIKKGESFWGQGAHTTLKDMYYTLNAMRVAGGGTSIKRESSDVTPTAAPKKKETWFEKSINTAIKELLEFFGIETKDKKYTPATEPGDGTYVDESSFAKPGTGGPVSGVRGNKIVGSFDIDRQLGGIPYKHVKFPSIAGPTITPRYIVIHNTAGSSLYLGKMKSKGIGTALWIDTNGDIILINKLTNRTWHVGGVKNLKGGAKQVVRSSNSIGIEMVCAYNKKAKQWNSYTEKQKVSLRKVVAFLMQQFNIPLSNVVAHIQIAYKTEGEGMEGLAVVNGVVAPEIPDGTGTTPTINHDVAATKIPNIDIPKLDIEKGDGTPVYDTADEVTKTAMRKKAILKDSNGKPYKPMDLASVLKDIDISLGKTITPSLIDMTKELKINNEYQETIAAQAMKGSKHELVIKDEKGKVLPKSTVAPDKMEFDRAIL